ncbi:hypothetical protein Clacol_004328 [Clathrus columnatus]|uniref:Uncharacterized protein n=1 Tax=Clathrus columnatus TaxID=1419009 RepID=A0AAV5A8U2_9AGAM|nr:hypothetical protein Clacol_004328 [Clathrus columnatus]
MSLGPGLIGVGFGVEVNLWVDQSHTLEPNQHDFLILDEYDVSPVTQLVIMGLEILQPQKSSVVIQGFTDPNSCNQDQLTSLKTNYGHPDFRGDNSGPTQFHTGLPTYNTPIDGVAPAKYKPSPALSKILSQLHNLEQLYISPFNFMGYVPSIRATKSNLGSLETFLNITFDNLISSEVKRLAFIKAKRDGRILRLIFNLINNCVLLSNLDMIEFQTSYCHWQYGLSLHVFGEELMNFLKLRQNAGYRALSIFKVNLNGPLPENCIVEAAVLETQVI